MQNSYTNISGTLHFITSSIETNAQSYELYVKVYQNAAWLQTPNWVLIEGAEQELTSRFKYYTIAAPTLSYTISSGYGIRSYLISAINVLTQVNIKSASYFISAGMYENGPIIVDTIGEHGLTCTFTHSSAIELTINFSENNHYGIHLYCLELAY